MSNKRMTMEDITNILYQPTITFAKNKDGYMIPYDIDGFPVDKELAFKLMKSLEMYLQGMDFEKLNLLREGYYFSKGTKRDIDAANNNYRNRKRTGNVYFIKRKDNAIKIGCSTNFKKRLKVLEREHGCLEIIHLIDTKNMYITEFAFHLLFNKKIIGNEWFDLVEKDIEYIKAGKYHNFIEKTIEGNMLEPDLYFEEITIGGK